MSKLAQYNKTIVTVLGLVLLVGADVVNNANGLLPASWANTLTIALGALTAFLTFWVRNETLIEGVVADVAHPTPGSGVDAAGKASVLIGEIRAEVGKLTGHPSEPVADLPQSAVNTATAGTYPDGPYVPPSPAVPYTGPVPPVSEPVGATAVNVT